MLRPPPTSTLFPYTTLFRSALCVTPRPRLYIHRFGVLIGSAQGPGEGRFSFPNSVAELRHVHCWLFADVHRSEEHTSELQSLRHLVCRLLLEKKKKKTKGET